MGLYGIVALCIVVILAVPALLWLVYYSWRNGISPMPTSARVRHIVSEQVKIAAVQVVRLRQQSVMVATELPESDIIPAPQEQVLYKSQNQSQQELKLSKSIQVVEAGSGWGTLALRIAQDNPGARITGIENSPLPLYCSRLLARLKGANIHFQQGDLYHYPYEQADIIVCYLFPGAMSRLSSILEQQCQAHTYVISVYFALPEWEPEQVIVCSDWYRTPVYVYRCGHRSYLA